MADPSNEKGYGKIDVGPVAYDRWICSGCYDDGSISFVNRLLKPTLELKCRDLSPSKKCLCFKKGSISEEGLQNCKYVTE